MSNAIKPDHYRKDRQYQPWDVAKDWDLDFDLGSVIKYIGRCVFIGIISFIVGSFSGICMICMCVVGGSGDESGADSNIEEEHKPEA